MQNWINFIKSRLVAKPLKPAQIARLFNEELGYKVTPSAIRKWDNLILAPSYPRMRTAKNARTYDYPDIMILNAVAVLRNLGYSIDDIRQILLESGGADQERLRSEIKQKIQKQKEGLILFDEYWEAISNKTKVKLIKLKK